MSRMSQLPFPKVPTTSLFLSRSLFLCYFCCAEISCLYFQVAVVSAFQNLFGAHGRYFPACPLFCFWNLLYGPCSFASGFCVYTRKNRSLDCSYGIRVCLLCSDEYECKKQGGKDIGVCFISVMHVTVFNPELYFDEHNGLLDCLMPICISCHLYCWVENLHGN